MTDRITNLNGHHLSVYDIADLIRHESKNHKDGAPETAFYPESLKACVAEVFAPYRWDHVSPSPTVPLRYGSVTFHVSTRVPEGQIVFVRKGDLERPDWLECSLRIINIGLPE